MGAFDWLDERNARDLIGAVNRYAVDVEKREDAAERRHRELVGRIDVVFGAFAVGLRAFADALDRGRR